MVKDLDAQVGHADLVGVWISEGYFKRDFLPVLVDGIQLVADVASGFLDIGQYFFFYDLLHGF